MSENEEKLAHLQARLENLVKTQTEFQREVYHLRNELHALRAAERLRTHEDAHAKPPLKSDSAAPSRGFESATSYEPPKQTAPPVRDYAPNFGYGSTSEAGPKFDAGSFATEGRTQLEKFIGENLISKIGIGILVIGVGIGAKYAIDNNLISPLTRIILGYIMGLGLVGFAVKLKPKYLNFSAVLLSGGMAIMYFITYFAYSLYQLIDQRSAFVLMLIFTAFTISAALVYSRQAIAHIGLVGAYAIPFLLSENSGNYAFLFSYIGIINAGVLAISVRKYWKPLFYTSFIFTWAIFYGWLMSGRFDAPEHYQLALSFLSVYFLIFYVTFLIYKVVSDENIAIENIGLVLANAFVFYGLGCLILDKAGFDRFLGLFTIGNAAIHFVFAIGAGRLKHVRRDLMYLLSALVLTFVTISIPIQFDGNRVTVIWTAEAAILFWIGRSKRIPVYELYSFPLMALSTVSLFSDWLVQASNRDYSEISTISYPIINTVFVGALFYVTAFALIWYLNRQERFEAALDSGLRALIGYGVGAAALFALYNTFRIEIGNYFHYQLAVTATSEVSRYGGYVYTNTDGDLHSMNVIWQINYTMLFLSALAFVNMERLRNRVLSVANVALNLLAIFVFLTIGLYLLSDLRDSFLLQFKTDTAAERSIFHIVVRYISYLFAAALLIACYSYSRFALLHEMAGRYSLIAAFDFVLHVSLLTIFSSELLNWMDILGYPDSHKLGLSILWGVYALALVALGIYNGKQYLRIGAIVLLGLTLAKLFLYDISELSTVARTVVFVSLGILMLIVSFLYNKYKSVIFGPNAV